MGDTFNACRIYYSGNKYPNHFVNAPIKRWDEGDWNVVIETFLDSSNRDTLFGNVVPGAVTEMYNILGTPKYWDTTYSSGNTLILEPQHSYGVSSLREKRIVAVKSITDTFINRNYFHVKIECLRLDT